jgi:glycosyltransferase involved in cell wall biosynthesis
LRRKFKHYFLFYPFAMRQFDLSGYDLILSSASSYSKGIRVPNGAVHICYCYTPPRFLWRTDDYLAKDNIGWLRRLLLKPLINILKVWDLATARNVDYFIAISKIIQHRIKKIYGRDSVCIYPPVSVDYFTPGTKPAEDYYLIISRLAPYKRVDLVIDAFNELKYPLRIVGRGLHEKVLKAKAGQTVQFMGGLSDREMLEQIRNCKALIFPGEEDFGMVPVEAQACGRPAIAFASAGALETIKEPETGVFFKEPTVESLKDAILRFEQMTFNPQVIREHAEQFAASVFKESIGRFVREKYNEKKGLQEVFQK